MKYFPPQLKEFLYRSHFGRVSLHNAAYTITILQPLITHVIYCLKFLLLSSYYILFLRALFIISMHAGFVLLLLKSMSSVFLVLTIFFNQIFSSICTRKNDLSISLSLDLADI